ncbi:hypoxanthine phosphoribosyltransferase [Maribellus sp. YY47]|uniref:hypoxanthine phosphoribosyltransferase n=1 Tax=Maribellus sp. YY47 TaxID=2929486 RepID=UPI0020007997|nr:hypoxanthine phosphoribosyltransferase [Maribellus sp. YY47]MCK3682703.1 hypoxanthine phosphoribosyltransferase [Maribellus sp. YY47]
MKRVKIHDKEFELFISNEKIQSVVQEMAEKMNAELVGKDPLFLCILNGSFMFAAEIFKRINFVESEISFVKLASYSGEHSTGSVKELIGLNENIEGRTVVVLEDIVDTGITINAIQQQLKSMNPKEIQVATMLLKPDALKKEVDLKYVGIEIPNDFIVGCGLDYDGHGRNLTDIYSVVKE